MRRASIWLGLCIAVPAQAGLFSDDDARKNIQQVEARVLKLEEQDRQQTQSIMDLQGQIEGLNSEIRKLRGQNEELAHGLQDAEKREKDFYVDLDTRLRHFESIEAAAAAKASEVPTAEVAEQQEFDAAAALTKAGKQAEASQAWQDFIAKYPNSTRLSDARYSLGNVQFAQKEYRPALTTYRALLKADPETAKAPDIYFNIAGCQQELKAIPQSEATLKLIVSKYPDSAAAVKAKKRLSSYK